jgi:hypothetical protein
VAASLTLCASLVTLTAVHPSIYCVLIGKKRYLFPKHYLVKLVKIFDGNKFKTYTCDLSHKINLVPPEIQHRLSLQG